MLYPAELPDHTIKGLHLFSALEASRSRPKQSVDCNLRILRFSPLLYVKELNLGTAGRARTGTDITAQGILSPSCLPIPSQRLV